MNISIIFLALSRAQGVLIVQCQAKLVIYFHKIQSMASISNILTTIVREILRPFSGNRIKWCEGFLYILSELNDAISPDNKLAYRWPCVCQRQCTWWWGRTCRLPCRGGTWPAWNKSHIIVRFIVFCIIWIANHLHMELDSSERGQCSQRASMAVRGMVTAVSRSDSARLIIRIFLRTKNVCSNDLSLCIVEAQPQSILWLAINLPCTVDFISFGHRNNEIYVE